MNLGNLTIPARRQPAPALTAGAALDLAEVARTAVDPTPPKLLGRPPRSVREVLADTLGVGPGAGSGPADRPGARPDH